MIDNYSNKKSVDVNGRHIPIFTLKQYIERRFDNNTIIIVTVGTLNANSVLDELEHNNVFNNTLVYLSEWLINKNRGEIPFIKSTNEICVPKIIHTVWFGNNEKTDLNKRCIESWYKYCPEYEIIEWNEQNYKSNNKYFLDSYNKGYYAHSSDYARLDIVYKYGGIYLDTDVEIIKNIDDLLHNQAFAGVYNPYGNAYEVALGLGFGAKKENGLILKMRDYYEKISFLVDGKPDDTPNTRYQTAFLKEKGFKSTNHLQIIEGMVIYPSEVLSPMDPQSREVNITDRTYMVHHFESSWANEERERNNNTFVIESKKIRQRLMFNLEKTVNDYH